MDEVAENIGMGRTAGRVLMGGDCMERLSSQSPKISRWWVSWENKALMAHRGFFWTGHLMREILFRRGACIHIPLDQRGCSPFFEKNLFRIILGNYVIRRFLFQSSTASWRLGPHGTPAPPPAAAGFRTGLAWSGRTRVRPGAAATRSSRSGPARETAATGGQGGTRTQ